MATKADFKAQREALGLAQQDIATALEVNIKTVKNWEKPGFQMPPSFAWDYLEKMNNRQTEMVNHAISTVAEIVESADGKKPGIIALTYYRTQEQYDEHGRDDGSFGFANAVSRIAAMQLRAAGYDVEFRYPDDGAIRTKGSNY